MYKNDIFKMKYMYVLQQWKEIIFLWGVGWVVGKSSDFVFIREIICLFFQVYIVLFLFVMFYLEIYLKDSINMCNICFEIFIYQVKLLIILILGFVKNKIKKSYLVSLKMMIKIVVSESLMMRCVLLVNRNKVLWLYNIVEELQQEIEEFKYENKFLKRVGYC